jgi:hypothetical protein
MGAYSLDLSEMTKRQRCFHEKFFYSVVLPNLSPLSTRPTPPIPNGGRFVLVTEWPKPITAQFNSISPQTSPSPSVPRERPLLEDSDLFESCESDFPLSENSRKPAKSRLNFTRQQRQLLMQFFFDHRDHPYADRGELEVLERQTNLTRKQIQVFMTNARMRKFTGFRRRKGSGGTGSEGEVASQS